MALVSVVVPAYDAAATIGDTLAAILAQTHADLEVLVVDDGSRDATADVVAAFAGRDPRVRLLRQANGGVAAARNHGIERARGEAIGFVDADDLWRPETVAALLGALRAGGAATGMAYCWSALIDERGCLIPGKVCVGRHQGDVLVPLAAGNFIGNASAVLVDRACLAELRFDASAFRAGIQGAEDWQFYLALAGRWRVALVPRLLVGYRQRRDSMSVNVASMLASHRRVAAALRRSQPNLDAALLRWSEAKLVLALARRAADADRPLLLLRLLAMAAVQDPWSATTPGFRQLAAVAPRCAAARLARPLRTPGAAAGVPFLEVAELGAAPQDDCREERRLARLDPLARLREREGPA